MNFKISKSEFQSALNLSSRAISSTTPLPSLSGIKIVVSSESLSLISSDSNISIRTSINNNDTNTLVIYDEGEIVIDSRYLLEIVRKIDGEFVNMEILDGTLVKISGGGSEFKINGMRASEYPQINFETTSANTPFILSSEMFSEIITQTAFACSDKEVRPVLTGVNFKAEGNVLKVNATDSYRLASKTINIDQDLTFNITIPAKYLSEVKNAIANEKEVCISIDAQKIAFIFKNSMIQTRLLDDTFPDVSRLIPASFSQILKVDGKALAKAVDRTSFIKSDGKNTVKLSIDSEKINITSSNNMGSSFENIPVLSYEGAPLDISCSGKYLDDAIKALKPGVVTICFSGELKPLIIKNEEDDTVIQLISPVRTYR